MNQLEAFQTLYDIIKTDKKHPDYDRVVFLADEYFALLTGVGLDEKLRRVASRENEEAFTERKKITQQICSSMLANLCHIFNRVPRSNGVKIKYTVEESKREDFKKILDNFGYNGFTSYVEQKLKDNIQTDPNKWCIVEFQDTDGTKYAQPYPYEISAKQAIMFEYENTNLIYLVDKKPIEIKDKAGIDKATYQWTIYCKEGAVVVKLLPDEFAYSKADFTETESIPENFNIENKSYIVEVPAPYNLSFVPARRVGYTMDMVTNGLTFVNMFDIIRPFLNKMLKVNSELDITMAKHAHMQKIQYVRKCTNTGCHVCDDGCYRCDVTLDNGEMIEKTCNVCNGRGYMDVTTGGLEYIYLPLPSSKDEILDLTNIVHYIALPVDVANLQNDYIDWLIEMCKKVMYNSDVFTKQQVSETATEKVIEMENVYDTLYPYAVNYAQFYSFVLDSVSEITGIDCTVAYSVNRDFKLLTKSELIEMISLASQAGVNSQILDALNDELAFAFYGESDSYEKYKLKQRLLPFQNQSKEQQTLNLSTLSKTSPYYVGFVFGPDIINELENENNDFYLLNFERQKALYDEKVNLIIETLKADMPEPPLTTNFGVETTPEETE